MVLSCFDAERREVAQVALEALMADGRIHPQRIEPAYAEALAGADERTDAAGHDAAERAGVAGLHPSSSRTLGRLRLRTSYGQNVLEHLVETAQLAAALAAEIGADVDVARRGAFLHDIGKALTARGAAARTPRVGADLARRLGESDVVVNAIAAHHDEVPPETVEAVLVQAADAISAARPGARREELDQYVERMDKLEPLVAAHAGVRRALAMSAGREVRVVVEPSEVDDYALPQLAVGDRPAHRGRPDLPGRDQGDRRPRAPRERDRRLTACRRVPVQSSVAGTHAGSAPRPRGVPGRAARPTRPASTVREPGERRS